MMLQRSLVKLIVPTAAIGVLTVLFVLAASSSPQVSSGQPQPGTQNAATAQNSATTAQPPAGQNDMLLRQSQSEADQKSAGCKTCHTKTDSATMHVPQSVRIGCTDCHGGNADIRVKEDLSQKDPEYIKQKNLAHPQPRVLANRTNGANPIRAYTELAQGRSELHTVCESRRSSGSLDDLRHFRMPRSRSAKGTDQHDDARRHAVGRGALQQWAFPIKKPHFGESYSNDGLPQRLITFPPPTPEETRLRGCWPFLEPIQRWEISQPGNVLRIFERGGRKETRARNTQSWMTTRPAGRKTGRARIWYAAPHRSRSFWDCRRPDCWIRCSIYPEPMTNQATTGTADAPPATWCMRTTTHPNTPGRTLRSVIRDLASRSIRPSRRMSQDIPSFISSRAASRRASAWSATCTRARTW